MTDIRVAGIGGAVLAASADIATFNTHAAELTAVPGGGVLAAGLFAIAIDTYRLRGADRQSPDDDPEREGIEPTAKIIEFRRDEESIQDIAEAA